ncbi:polysaccharide deacetylase family protein [Nocardioides marinquilinus]|uniref:polysaccharide deacetylase family protein n=1 Tax=Nocardioides marinquilinus TaxID=1210400 RepID=UPI0031E6ACC1
MNVLAVGGRVAAAAGRLVMRRSGRGGGVVLGYHDVVDAPEADLELSVTVAQLRTQLLTVRRAGFRIVPLADLLGRLLAGDDVDGLAAVSFDDGLAGVPRHALPVLHELEVPATVFAVTSCWGGASSWWPEAGPVMTRAELVSLHEAGLAIGAHTRTHRSLPGLTDDELRAELAGGRDDLEQLVGAPVDLLAYPFGHHDPRVRAATQDAGFAAAHTFRNGRVGPADDRWRLARFTMTRRHTRSRLAYHLARTASSWPPQPDRALD